MTQQTFGPSTKSRAKTTKRFVEFKVWVVFRSLVASEGLFTVSTWNPISNDPYFDWKRPCFGGLFRPKKEDQQLPGIGIPEAFRKTLAGGNSNIFNFHPENWGR